METAYYRVDMAFYNLFRVTPVLHGREAVQSVCTFFGERPGLRVTRCRLSMEFPQLDVDECVAYLVGLFILVYSGDVDSPDSEVYRD